MRKFDKSKPHAQVWGDGAGIAKFVQDGRYFDHDGNECQFGQVEEQPERTPVLASGPASPAPQVAAIDADTIIAARRGNLMVKALPILEGKAEEIIGELEDHDSDLLTVMLEAETLMKKRKTVLEALQGAILAKQAEDQRNEVAQGQQPQQPVAAGGAPSPVDSQLANQLGS